MIGHHDGFRGIMQSRPTVTPLSALRQPAVLTWAVLAGIALAAVLALAPGVTSDRLVHFGLSALLVQWVILSTLALLYMLQRLLSRVHWRWVFLTGLLLLLSMTVLVHVAAGWLLFGQNFQLPPGWAGSTLRAAGIALIVYLLGAAALLNHVRAQHLALTAKQAELEALLARTHPHFLFNTLNTGIALLHHRPEAAEQLLLDLSDLFRATLAGPRNVELADELDLTRRYLAIEELRLGPRLEVVWKVPDRLPDLVLPALSLQPLIENAVRHGIEPRVGGGRIDVKVEDRGSQVVIVVCNDLPARSAARSGSNGHGVGQPSVASRIEEMTGGQGSLTTTVIEGRYTATITMPMTPSTQA